MNKFIGIGRITKDIILERTHNNKFVTKFTLAINRRYNRDEADFINCVAWEKTAEFMERYLGKGKLVAVEGEVRTRSYDDKDGKRVYMTEILVSQVEPLERIEAGSVQQGSHYQPQPQATTYQFEEQPKEDMLGDVLDISSDDLPF